MRFIRVHPGYMANVGGWPFSVHVLFPDSAGRGFLCFRALNKDGILMFSLFDSRTGISQRLLFYSLLLSSNCNFHHVFYLFQKLFLFVGGSKNLSGLVARHETFFIFFVLLLR